MWAQGCGSRMSVRSMCVDGMPEWGSGHVCAMRGFQKPGTASRWWSTNDPLTFVGGYLRVIDDTRAVLYARGCALYFFGRGGPT